MAFLRAVATVSRGRAAMATAATAAVARVAAHREATDARATRKAIAGRTAAGAGAATGTISTADARLRAAPLGSEPTLLSGSSSSVTARGCPAVPRATA